MITGYSQKGIPMESLNCSKDTHETYVKSVEKAHELFYIFFFKIQSYILDIF